jgi:hypothetical protein
VLAVLVVLATGCIPARTASSVGGRSPSTSLTTATFTRDGGDVYTLAARSDTLTVSAPASNTGSNTRMGIWGALDEDTADQRSCATWTEAVPGLKQQGAVLRARTRSGRTTAITVTQNIAYGVWWGFHIHVMDSASSAPFHEIATFDLREVFAPGYPDVLTSPPYPWRMCARAVRDVVSFIVWPTSQPQPAWDDARYGGSVRLPPGWGAPGAAGLYAGHIEPGKGVGFADRSVVGLRPDRSPAAQEAVRAELAEPATPPVEPTWIARAP